MLGQILSFSHFFQKLYIPLYNIELAAPPTKATATPIRVKPFNKAAILHFFFTSLLSETKKGLELL